MVKLRRGTEGGQTDRRSWARLREIHQIGTLAPLHSCTFVGDRILLCKALTAPVSSAHTRRQRAVSLKEVITAPVK